MLRLKPLCGDGQYIILAVFTATPLSKKLPYRHGNSNVENQLVAKISGVRHRVCTPIEFWTYSTVLSSFILEVLHLHNISTVLNVNIYIYGNCAISTF